MRATEFILNESAGVRLGDLAAVGTNMPDADFWIVRKGSEKAVGKPIKEFEPQRIGVKVIRTDVIDANYLYYLIVHLHSKGYFAQRANGVTNLVNIRVADVSGISFAQNITEGNPNQQIALYNPNGKTYQGSYNKMPTLDPKDPGHQSNGYRIDPNKSYETDFDKEDLKRVISRGMSSLTDSDKHILELRFWDDLTYNEIAAKLGIPSQQVKNLEALALRKLKDPKISNTLRPYSWLQGMAEATGDEQFDSMMGRLAIGAAARQGVDRLSTSLAARTGSNPEAALANWGQEFIKWLEKICRNIAKQGVDKFSKFEKLGNSDDGGETMAHWLIEVAKQSNTSGITLADIQEFSSEFNSHGMWAWQQFPIAWSQSEWQDYKDQWTGPDGYIANLGQGVEEGLNEFAMSDGDDGEDPTDNYPCYDCGSTIFLHHTKLCDLAEPNAKHDLPARPGSQHWTGEVPKGLHPIPGLQEGVAENRLGTLHLGPLTIEIDDHALDRARQRGIDPYAVDRILKKLTTRLDKLEKIELGERFWVYDVTSNIALGIRRLNNNRYYLKTMIGTQPQLMPGISKIITLKL